MTAVASQAWRFHRRFWVFEWLQNKVIIPIGRNGADWIEVGVINLERLFGLVKYFVDYFLHIYRIIEGFDRFKPNIKNPLNRSNHETPFLPSFYSPFFM
jgi:hypothetical protein